MFKTAILHIKRTPFQSTAVILNMGLAFFLLAAFFFLATGTESILRYLELRPQLSAFLKDEVVPQQVELLKGKIESSGKAKGIKYISKEEALAIYRKEIKDNPLLLEMVTAKILPASLEISVNNLTYLPEIAQMLKDDPIVEDVLYQEDVVSVLSRFTSGLRKTGIFLFSFLAMVSFLNVVIIVGMKVSHHREEMEILNLIGASSWYVKSPFLAEGIIYGVVASSLGWLLAFLLLLYSIPFLVQFLAGIPLFPVPVVFLAGSFVGTIFLGILIGGLGSLWAVRRFPKSVK